MKPESTSTTTRSTVSIRPAKFAAEPQLANPDSTADRQWSPFQSAIFDFVESGRGSAVVIAVAGSGKTTTIVEAARRLPTSLSCAFVAFNKSIADELKLRLPSHVRAQTLNSLGFGAWRRHIGDSSSTLRLDSNKTRLLCRELIPDRYYAKLSKSMPRLIGIAKSAGVVPIALADSGLYSGLVEDSDSLWPEMVEDYGLDFDLDIDQPADSQLLADTARGILSKSISTSTSLIDFDDQLYMPVITGARFWQNDLIFVDEAQDISRIQRVMIRRALKPTGRLIAVGDPNQAIYGFRGADSSSIARIKQEFSARELPLTISYRCPKSVVLEARQWVSHITSHESASEGSVSTLSKYTPSTFKPSDIIVCRNSKPLIALAFQLLKSGVPCKVRGRDIGAGLVALIRRFKVSDLQGFRDRLDDYTGRKLSEYMSKFKDVEAQRLQDQYDTLCIFADAVEAEGHTDVASLIARIESMFTDNGPSVLMLSTIHKAKGLEFDRVFILDRDLMPSRFARTPESKQQESNLQYVAVTRSKCDVVYIQSKGLREAASV